VSGQLSDTVALRPGKNKLEIGPELGLEAIAKKIISDSEADETPTTQSTMSFYWAMPVSQMFNKSYPVCIFGF
jgi:hypothetical protein